MGILSSNASAKNEISSTWEINLEALSSNEEEGFLNSIIYGSKDISSKNFSSEILDLEQISLEYLCNSLISFSGANNFNLCSFNNLLVKESDLNKENIILVSTTNFIYNYLDLNMDFLSFLPNIKQSSSVSSDPAKSLSNFSNTSNCFIRLENASLAIADQFNQENFSIFFFNSLGKDKVIFSILDYPCLQIYYVDTLFKSFDNRELSNFNLTPITKTYQDFEEGKELYFLNSENELIRIKNITKQLYNGKIYDVDVENDIVLVRRKNREGKSSEIWSGNSNHGTAQGDAKQTDAGYFGKGFEFDGDEDLIYSNNVNGLNVYNLTISVWVYPQSEGISMILHVGDSHIFESSGYMFRIESESDPTDLILIRGNGITSCYVDSSNVIPLNKWSHVVVTHNADTGNFSFYVNGSFLNSGLDYIDNITQSQTKWAIGRATNTNVYDFKGTIDDILVFNRTLSAEEIRALYANQSEYYLEQNFTSLSEGEHTFKAYTQDLAGNLNWTEEREVTVDTTSPTINVYGPGNDSWN